MAYLGKGRIAELRYIARQLGEKVTDDLKMIYFKNLMVNSTNYEEEFVREMLNLIIEKRLRARTSRVNKYFDINERYILSTYELQTLFKLKKHNSGTINKAKSKSENVSLNPCIIKSNENEVEMSVLKDTGASLDIGCKKFAAPEMLTGEHALVEHIPDNNMTCLRPAQLKIISEPRHVVSKAVVGSKHLDREKYILENQTIELLESNLEQNGLPKLEIENATQVSSPRRKEVEEKSISLTNEVDKIVFEGNLVENVEILVASFTKDDKDTMNSIKINVHEITEALLKNEESAPSIQKIEKGMNNESGRSTHAIRRGIFAKSSVDRSTGHPAGNKYIKSDMCTMRQYRFLIHPPCGSFVADRRGFPKEIEPDKGSLFMNNRVISNIGNLLSFTNAI